MSELRRDVDRWNIELRQLRAEGHHDLVERIGFWIKEAEGIDLTGSFCTKRFERN